ncbi:DUF885 domain-containing protein [Qipengyuania qiaonensis]|uniref:DUF885 domain-containing protein n=1 Tax=Qipengyuania qiaonensis TaxID=2867240 RepID=A0ABS7JB48_9SPHN|nr:DUF885 domain-containing protein [Qipengyuania qiaonensis]MBX7482938.1 DUF885 domain-containing protein [Qipengyuania qiaonensis]
MTSSLRRLLILSVLLLPSVVAAPALAQSGDNPLDAPKAADSEESRLHAWLDGQYEELLDRSPMAIAYAGGKDRYDEIDDMSEEAARRTLEWQRRSIDELHARFDRSKLGENGQLSWDLWIFQYREAAMLWEVRRNAYVFNQMSGPQTAIPQFLMQIHRVDEPADMDAYIARIGGVARAELQLLQIAKRHAANGVRPPRFAYEMMIPQVRTLATGAPFGGEGDSPIWADAVHKIDSLQEAGKIDQVRANSFRAEAREALLSEWQPAFEQLAAWFESELPKADIVATGVGGAPGGKDFYRAALANSTTTSLTADEIHMIGLREVARIREEMELVKDRTGFDGSLGEFFKFIREDDRFYEPSTEAGRQAFLDSAANYVDEMKSRLPLYFNKLPKADIIVKRVEPYREIPGGAAHYSFSTSDGTRPGAFYLHLINMRSNPKPFLEATVYHEALPGHHLNFAIARELDTVPKFRKYLYINAYQEGWGLYAEKLAKEMGGYRDPYSDFGRLTAEIWRAARLVVDTGLHDKGWTEEEAVEYMAGNTALSIDQIRSEVRRYVVMPGQATGYMIGLLKLERLRQKAEREMGDEFDLRRFHDLILDQGQMPFDLLEHRVDRLIATSQAASASAAIQ